jgi:isoleucyl-tRNA synthetase
MVWQTLEVNAGGETYQIISEEVEVKAQAKEGFAVAEDGAYVAALVTDLTPELVPKVRRVNSCAACKTCARLPTWTLLTRGTVRRSLSRLRSAIEAHAETLTSDLQFASPPNDASVVEDSFDGETIKVGLVKK